MGIQQNGKGHIHHFQAADSLAPKVRPGDDLAAFYAASHQGTIEIKEVPNKNGSGTYTAYVKFDFDKMQPRSYRNNPDLKQAKEQIPTNENKVQVAVNEQGKTHEATKHTKEPLSPGQSAPKNEKQQKEQNAEEQKPKRKARSVKM